MKTNSEFQESPDKNQARVLIDQVTSDPAVVQLPTFPDSVYEALPAFLQKVVARCDSNEDRDMMLLGSLVSLGSCLPRVFGIYGGKRVYPCIYLFIIAQASAGKGNLVYCRQLVNPVHEALCKQTELAKKRYKTRMKQYNLLRWKEGAIEKPDKPLEKMLFIPANNSASGAFEILSENDGRGLIFETEGDTLSHAFKADGGNYSDGMRKAFHHEMYSFHRRKDREHVEIKKPCISMVLTGTNRQVTYLIPDAENGLLSRVLFYHMNLQTNWKDMLDLNIEDMEDYFDSLGREFYPFYKALEKHPAIRFCLTEEQHREFNIFFSQVQEKYLVLQGTDYIATVRRLGLIAFRMAMILTTLRIMETKDFSQKQECRNDDFQRVLSMIRVLVRHSSHVFSQLPEMLKTNTFKDKKEQFLELLPEKFSRQEYLDRSKSLLIEERTADRYMVDFCEKGLVLKEKHGLFTNLTLPQTSLEE